MSSNSNDNRSGFKNSRIDLSQLGDDSWNKPLSGKSGAPGPRRKPAVAVMPSSSRRTKLDDLFETRVQAATGRRAVSQSKGQNRVWLFAGGLFLASVGGIAAAYYLVGPPMAISAYDKDGAGFPVAQTSSLEVESNTAGTSSHFIQGVPASTNVNVSGTNVSGATTDYMSGASVMAQPPAYGQSDTGIVIRDPIAPSISDQPVAVNATAAQSEAAEPQQSEVAEPQKSEAAKPQQNDVAAVEKPAEAEPKTVTAQPETERMVRIVPTAVSEEVETKTNVNASKVPASTGGSAGQWLALPAESKPAAPSAVTAAAPQQPSQSDPVVAEPVKTQQELFKAFQAYLESSGHTAKGNQQSQEALFNKFIRWSVEVQKEN